MRTTILWDASNLAYRCRYTYSLSNRGEDVSVVYGFIASIASECKKFKPDSVIVCWDAGIPIERKAKFPEYKAGRHDDEDKDAREDFKRQLKILEEIIPDMGISSVKVGGYEADDLIYTISRILIGRVIIITSDKDMLQAISGEIDGINSIEVYNPIKKLLIIKDNFESIIGLSPDKYLDYKIMVGDSSDKLKGIKGIGNKLALEILSFFDDLNQAIFNAKLCTDEDWPLSTRAQNVLKKADVNQIIELQEVLDNSHYSSILIPYVLDQIDEWKLYDNSLVTKFLMNNSFVSMMSGKLKKVLEKLEKPEYLEVL